MMSRAINRLSRTDTLTNIANRLYLNDFLELAIQRAERYAEPVSVIMLDLDNFKQINDTYGHAMGDQVLVQTARSIEGHIRKVDLLGRWGGEEFLIICPGIKLDGAAKLAEKLRVGISRLGNDDAARVTGSFGIDEYVPGQGRDALLQAVDKRLYQAKELGRNQVYFELSAS